MIVMGVGEDLGRGVLPGEFGFGVFDTRLATVVDGGALGIPNARCRVSSMDRITLSLRRSQFTSVASLAR